MKLALAIAPVLIAVVASLGSSGGLRSSGGPPEERHALFDFGACIELPVATEAPGAASIPPIVAPVRSSALDLTERGPMKWQKTAETIARERERDLDRTPGEENER